MAHINNTFKSREKDWRNGAIIYQVIVDRFSPSKDIDAKKDLYQFPRTLKSWNELPQPGEYLKDAKYYAHELEFWGGDLNSLIEKLDYIKSLGIDIIYLNPIHESLSNHKYDATNYLKISPEFGDFKDLKKLIDKVHQAHMKIMLDGVFNHVGVNHAFYKLAQNEKNPYRKWFDFDKKYPEGVRLWADARSLPELNLENAEVKDHIYRSDDSVIKTYLKAGIDGWRLDVAFDIGFDILHELSDEAHLEKPGSMIVGEIWNYPKDWFESIDGVMNFTFRELILKLMRKEIEIERANQMLEFMIKDCGIEPLLKSWLVLDNHDVPRLRDLIKDEELQKLAQVLQFTLPGSPNLYYGTELGMEGGSDPRNRAPMAWNLVSNDNHYLNWTKKLVQMHQQERALKIGDYVAIHSNKLIAFERKTEHVMDTVLVFVNPSDTEVKEHVLIPDSKLMNYSEFDITLGEKNSISLIAGFMEISLNPKSFVIIKPVTYAKKSYTPYKRV